ncbi:unnamed protein product [Pelagomonas calceolata]|uniref:Uncharacterized protein n=1 Tax=Pelagomonas calceolata TaxID=35677 RepID=A0A7S3ZLZ7_9STRA|nr:unnamed protein product [Pelagomonas calceolata]|mmetsp:Transcript_7433/g.20682  ORF Transcript_7433/g.20682 Transcript_7433/m.20682 type:complete len:475 (-) Transcript_7433:56-1480(-)
MRATAWLIVALCALGALADEPKKKKNAKPKKEKKDAKKEQKQKDCPACPADLSDELAAATARAEKAEAKTCPEDLSEALAAAETRASIAEEKAVELQKNVDDEIAKVVEAKKDAKHWKAQVDGLEEALQSTKAALATSHAEPVVPGVSISNDGTVAFNATDGLIAAQNGAGAALAMAGEAAKTGYQALVDAIPTEEAKKLGEDAVDAMYGAVDKGKAKTAEAYGNAWGYAVANEYVAPATQSQVEEKVSVAYSKAASITSDVCYDKIPSLYEKHAKKYVDAALIEIGERKALATVELRELFAHAQQALHDRVQQLKEKLPTSADLKSRADSAREVVALRFHALLVAAGACDETSDVPCAPAKRLASACVACWAVAACVLLLIAAYHLVGMLLGLAKKLVVAVGKRAVRLPLMLIKLAIALVVLAVSLALKLALLPLRIVLLPVTLPLALLARKKGPAKASARPPRKNSPARGRR